MAAWYPRCHCGMRHLLYLCVYSSPTLPTLLRSHEWLLQLVLVGNVSLLGAANCPCIAFTSRGSLPLASFHCCGALSTTFPWQRFYDGTSTLVILVVIMMLGQCMLPEIAFDNSESNDDTWSDGVYSFRLCWVSQALGNKMCLEMQIFTVCDKATPHQTVFIFGS